MEHATGSIRIHQETHPLDGRPTLRLWAPDTLEAAGGFCQWFDTVQDGGTVQAWSSQPATYLYDDLGGGRARILIGDLPGKASHDQQALCDAANYWRNVVIVDIVEDVHAPQLWVRDVAGGTVGVTDPVALDAAAHLALCSSLIAAEDTTERHG